MIDPSRPARVGDGPVEFSTCTELRPDRTRRERPVWDTNGYYRLLGVSPDATRKALRIAYDRCGGPDDPRMTYALRVLLSERGRAYYDRVPLGEQMLDPEVRARRRSEDRLLWASSLMAMSPEERTRAADSEEAFFRPDSALDFLDFLDKDGGDAQHDPQAYPALGGYGHYLWWVRPRDDARAQRQDEEKLARWRDALIRAASALHHKIRLAVGLHGGSESYTARTVGKYLVAFVRVDLSPTEADHAALLWIVENIPRSALPA